MDPDRTVSRSLELTPELLSSQGRSLRALARSLLGDAHAAEDVEQETWLVYLAGSKRIHGRLSAWLTGVARHLAHRSRRGVNRRRAREQRAASGERVEAVQEKALLREEMLRSLTHALLALEEPYRTPLILRFFEDCTPLEIARELDLAPSTVKSRIERGLERLRVQLTTEHGGTERWTSGLVLLSGARSSPVGPGSGTASGSITTGIGALLMSWKVSVVAAVVVAGSLVWWTSTTSGSDDEPALSGSPVAVASATGSGAARSPAQETADVPAQVREPATEEAQAAPAPGSSNLGSETSYPFRIKGLVRDEYDRPLASAFVFLAPRGFPVNQLAFTDVEGRFEIAFQARSGAFPALFSVQSDDLELGPIEIQLAARCPFELDVAARPDHDTEKEWFSGGTSGQTLTESDRHGTRPAFRNALERAVAQRRGHDSGTFRWPLPGGTCLRDSGGEGVQLEASLDRIRLEHRLREVRSGQHVIGFTGEHAAQHSGSSEPTPLPAVVRGIVRDVQDAPASRAVLSWRLGGSVWTRYTDEQGNFGLTDVTSGTELVIEVGGGDLGRASARFLLLPGEERVWDPLLDRGAEVRGRLLGPDGNPIAPALVELWKVDSAAAWNDATFTRPDGAFAIPNVPEGSFELHVVPDGRVGGFPARVVTRVQPNDDLGNLVLTADELTRGALRVKLVDADGETPRDAEVRVWQEGSRRGRFGSQPDDEGAQTLTGLPPGRYRIEVGCELGWRDLGSPWLAPCETLDLGVVRFESAGVFSIDVPYGAELGQPPSRRLAVEAALGREHADSGHMTLSRLHPDIDALVVDGPARSMRQLLAPGRYRLALQSDSARATSEFRVSPGVTSSFAWREANGVRELVEADPLPSPALDQASCAGCHTNAVAVGSALRDG